MAERFCYRRCRDGPPVASFVLRRALVAGCKYRIVAVT
jgi:hypothetical protein